MFEVEKKKIKTLFNETKIFVIPDFQRGFSWGTEEIDEFFEDLKNESFFFIGSFIFKTSKDEHKDDVEIIDGQQRTVTLSLFYAALSHLFDNTLNSEDEENAKLLAHDLRRSIAEVDPTRPKNISKFKINFKDDNVNNFFANILTENNISNLPNETELQLRVNKAYRRIISLIETETSSDYNKLVKLKEKIESTEVIIISIQKDELAYQIFETVNARGVDLTVSELLKNHLFKTISDHVALKAKWLEITDNLRQTQAKQIDLPAGLRFYWISNFEHTTKRQLYRSIKDALKKGKITEQALLEEIFNFSVDLSIIYDQNPQKWSSIFGNTSAEKRQAARWFYYKRDATSTFDKSVQFLPIYTSLLKQKAIFDVSSSAFRRLIHSIESINFIYLEILNLPGNVLEKKYSEYSRRITGSKTREEITKHVDGLTKELQSLVSRQENSKTEVIKYVSSLRFSRRRDYKIIMFIFSRMENLWSDFGVVVNYNNVSAEHIFSQSEAGSKSEVSVDTSHSIGNLTIMEFSGPNGNGALNNKPFEEKKLIYKDSPYFLTRDLCNYDAWDKVSINSRTALLAEAVWNIWGPNQKIKDFI